MMRSVSDNRISGNSRCIDTRDPAEHERGRDRSGGPVWTAALSCLPDMMRPPASSRPSTVSRIIEVALRLERET